MNGDEQVMTTQPAPPGRDKPICGAARRRIRAACRRPAGWGTPHPGLGPCKLHGGSTRNHVRRAEVARAEQVLTALGRTVREVDDPLTELRLLAGEVVTWKERISQIVASLSELTIGDLAAVRGEVLVYEKALAQTAIVLTAIAKLGIDERLVRIGERQGGQLAQVVTAAIDAMDPTPQQRAAGLAELARQIQALLAGTPVPAGSDVVDGVVIR